MKSHHELQAAEAVLSGPAWGESVAAAKADLSEAYQDYVSEVSEADMAMSLEAAAFLLALCRAKRPQKVADLGSGFSSYVLRRYAAESDESVHVVSVDDNDEWLDKTRGYLEAHQLDVQGLMQWDIFRVLAAGQGWAFDVVFHDLGNMATRREAFDVVLTVSEQGVCLVDDMHKAHSEVFEAKAERVGRKVYDLKPDTLDQYGRWAVWVSPKG